MRRSYLRSALGRRLKNLRGPDACRESTGKAESEQRLEPPATRLGADPTEE